MSYQFSPELDHAKLNELYLGDPAIAYEVFSAFVTETSPTLPGLQAYFLADEKDEFRRLIHKIKPGFLYVGLTDIFEKMSAMEGRCDSIDSLHSLEEEFNGIVSLLGNKLPVVHNELEKLKRYSISQPG
jgi:HPt (histidine-containing phosphotransfer) domain-containing protein